MSITPNSGLDDTLIAAGNWGDRYIGAPTVWNLIPALARAGAAATPVQIAIVDGFTFFKHEDLVVPDRTREPYRQWPANTAILSLHGQEVLGISRWKDPTAVNAQKVRPSHGTVIASEISGEWGNRKYVDGLLPFAALHASSVPNSSSGPLTRPISYGEAVQSVITKLRDEVSKLRFVNMSIGVQVYGLDAQPCCPRDPATGRCARDADDFLLKQLPGDYAVLGCDLRDPSLENGHVTGEVFSIVDSVGSVHHIQWINDCDIDGIGETPDKTAEFRRALDESGRLFSRLIATERGRSGKGDVLVVASAGNDTGRAALGCDLPHRAHWKSPMTNAALRWFAGRASSSEAPSILVAEGLELEPTAPPGAKVRRANYSNIVDSHTQVPRRSGTHVEQIRDAVDVSLLAPGDVQGAVGGCDRTNDAHCDNPGSSSIADAEGTSFSAPRIIAAAGWLTTICPKLTNEDLHEFLFPSTSSLGAVPVLPSGVALTDRTDTRRVLDLARSVRELAAKDSDWQSSKGCIIGVLDSKPSVGLAWSDLSDGTPDGFAKTELNVDDQLDGHRPPPIVTFSETPDDHVDMRDFRRWRDLYLLANGVAGGLGWGAETQRFNPARDVNANGLAWSADPTTIDDCPFGESVCPLACVSNQECPTSCSTHASDENCTTCNSGLSCEARKKDSLESYSRGLLGAPLGLQDYRSLALPKVSLDDLVVLQQSYHLASGSAERWTAEQLPALRESADLWIQPTEWLNAICSGAAQQFFVTIKGEAPIAAQTQGPALLSGLAAAQALRRIPFPADGSDFVITTPLLRDVEIEIVDENDHNVFGAVPNYKLDLKPGEDRLIHFNSPCAIREKLLDGVPVIPLFVGAKQDTAYPAGLTDLRGEQCVQCISEPGDLEPNGGTGGTGGSGGSGGTGGEGGDPGGGGTGSGGCDPACMPGQHCVDGVCRPDDDGSGGSGSTAPICGNHVCEGPSEDPSSCPEDCPLGAGGAGGTTGSGGNGSGGSGSCGPSAVDDVTCDGIDDDCDHLFDEDFPTEVTFCGEGECRAAGVMTCIAGQEVDTCQASEPVGDDTNCNGRDDDCDSVSDESYTPTASTCGLGVCASHGMKTCVNGAIDDSCTSLPAAGSDSNCDGKDDDCDGIVDEGYAPHQVQCGCSTVASSCEQGAESESCAFPPLDASCDGVDDDCDGSQDEDYQSEEDSCLCGGTAAVLCISGAQVSTCAPGPCPAPPSSGVGDPHMHTPDGLAYEFQQVGEYVYSTDGGDFVLQVRTGPYNGSSTVASNHALAANVAGDRVGYYYGANEPLLVDGAPVAVPAGGLMLAHGGRVARTPNGYQIVWPGGEVVAIGIHGLLNITINVPDRTKHYDGLLGTWDGNPRNDLVPRGGAPLPWPISQDQVYGIFGDSWRVTAAESLFDYGPGEDTTTFTDEAFPSHVVTAATLPTQQFNEAHAACVEAGIEDEAQLEGCILDVAASGGDASVAAATAEAALPPTVERVVFNGYYQNFEGQDDGAWSTPARHAFPSMDLLAPTHALGLIGGGQEVVLTIGGLPAHTDVSVAFDTNIVGPWAGDVFEGNADGVPFTTTGFSNTAALQAFPAQLGAGESPARTGAMASGTQADATERTVYHHSYTFTHSASSLTVSFVAPSLPAGASFALDNVAVVTGIVGDPWNPRCLPGGPALDDGNPCTIDQCDPSLGAIHTPRPAGTSCSDGVLCNGAETCNASGHCGGTPLVVNDNNPCTIDACDPQVGVVHTPAPQGTACSNGDKCDGVEACDGLGACAPGVPPDPGSFPPDSSCNGVDDDCDGVKDDDYVALPTSCGQGACAATGELRCTNGHVVNTCTPLFAASYDVLCDEIDDDCDGRTDEDYQPTCSSAGVTSCASGTVVVTSCDDHDACTADGCGSGGCTHSAVQCSDGNACTADSCDPVLGCGSIVNTGAACSDGDACTSGDTCSSAAVCSGSPIDVDDGNPCTDDLCDPVSGAQHLAAIGRPCDDGDACTLSEVCDVGGACAPGATRDCSDGAFCNGVEGCNPAIGCVAATPPAISDGVACTADRCDEVLDRVVHEPNDVLCDDQNVCNGAETCDPGLGCRPGTALLLDDGNLCTVDACDPVAGVKHTLATPGGTCGSGQYCDGTGQCLAFGVCATNLVVSAGQNLTFTGPCQIDSITFNGGNLTVNGSLKIAQISMASGGTLRIAGGSLLADAITLSNGTINVDSNVTGVIRQSGGMLRVGGPLSVAQASDFLLSGGTLTNDGAVTLPVFDASVVSGGTFINHGQLDVADNSITVASGVTLNQSGTVNDANTIGALRVEANGVLTHDARYLPGLQLHVIGNATVETSGRIDVTGKGLSGGTYNGATNTRGGENYVWDGTQYAIDRSNWYNVGGSHGGVGSGGGVAPYGDVQEPTLLGGGSSGLTSGYNGVAGGGRIDLRVDGTLLVKGKLVADGATRVDGTTVLTSGAGGSIWLRVGALDGVGQITANGPQSNYASGGGGRVALDYASRAGTITVQASGASSSGAGTVFERNTTTGTETLRMTGGGVETPVTSGNYSEIALSGGVAQLSGTTAAAKLTLSGGTMTVANTATPTTVQVSGGTLNLQSPLEMSAPGSFVVSGGAVNVQSLMLGAGALLMTAGTFTNNGVVSMPSFDASMVKGGTFINHGQLNIASNSLTVASNVTLSQSGTVNDGNTIAALKVEANGQLTHDARYLPGLQFHVTGDATIDTNGRIDVTGKGLSGGTYNGATNVRGGENYVWDGTQYVIGRSGWYNVGGSHGGVGSGGSVAPYGDVQGPTLLGGGSSGLTTGHNGVAGGGHIDLRVDGTLLVKGKLVADGATRVDGTTTLTSGAGGSIWLRVGALDGVGQITANGPQSNYASGGGGRVALQYGSRAGSVTLQANGATTSGPGTVFERNTTTGTSVLRLGSGGLETPVTSGSYGEILLSAGTLQLAGAAAATQLTMTGGTLNVVGALAPTAVSVSGGTLNVKAGGLLSLGSSATFSMTGGTLSNAGTTIVPAFNDTTVRTSTFKNTGRLDVLSNSITVASGVTLSESGTLGASDSIGSLTILSGGTLTHERRNSADTGPLSSGLSFTVTGNANIAGTVEASGLGLRGGNRDGNTAAAGETYAADQFTIALGATGHDTGGSHGGLGGVNTSVQANVVSPVYGSAAAPVLLGSGGGGLLSPVTRGGHGGGRIDLVVNGTLTIGASGVIKANGGVATGTPSGGGAGGSVRLRVGTLDNGGTISANGGNGGVGGGGGRVSIEYLSETSGTGGTISAAPGSGGGVPAQAGSVNLRDLTAAPGSATADLGAVASGVCLLAGDGSIACSGDDAGGLVSQAPVGSYKKLAVGPYAVCALHESGIASCWADDGAFGLYETSPQPLSDVSVGLTAACGLRTSDSSVVCWGSDADGIVSGKPSGSFARVHLSDSAACARAADGTLSCWGNDSAGAVSDRPAAPVASVDGGDGFYCAVLATGELSCWGANDHAQCVAPAGASYSTVSAGKRHACAVDSNGSAVCWGDDASGQSTPAPGVYTAVSAADVFTCGLAQSGELSCWGDRPF